MNNSKEKIESILALLGKDYSYHLDDAILIPNENDDGETEVSLFRSKQYFVTVDDNSKIIYWKSTYLAGDVDDNYIRHYCGLPQEEVILERDIFVAGLVEPIIHLTLNQVSAESPAFV
jgi:hypothetical protein